MVQSNEVLPATHESVMKSNPAVYGAIFFLATDADGKEDSGKDGKEDSAWAQSCPQPG